MERWNELVAGYVLGNLTKEEQAELEDVLRENPQLKLDIARLRKTATMSRVQTLNWSLQRLEAGSEGWADTADVPVPTPDQVLAPSPSPTTVPSDVSTPDAETPVLRPVLSLWRRFGSFCMETSWPRTSMLGWLMAVLLVSVGLDNWRMRRLLAIAQERILELELLVEYSSTNAD